MWTKSNIPDQRGKTIIVTGANTGIGYETALALYQAGAHVVLACRNMDKAKAAQKQLEALKGKGTLEILKLNLSDLNDVRAFAAQFLQSHKQLSVLINNAGVANTGENAPDRPKTADGYEEQFGINFLGHFALTACLYPLLKATPGARIVTVSSNGYQGAHIDFDNLRSENSYNPMREYRQSKLANLMFAIELDRRIKQREDGVLSVAAQPGANKTELVRHMTDQEIATGKERIGEFMEPWQGALSLLYAAVSPDALGGNLYEPEEGGFRGYPTLSAIKENALDEAIATRLWDLAEELTGVVYL
ncbi:MAG: oxidoreductase [Bacteroidota bacterium]|nr:oxidoreductase [Bacteroidota bacterium]